MRRLTWFLPLAFLACSASQSPVPKATTEPTGPATTASAAASAGPTASAAPSASASVGVEKARRPAFVVHVVDVGTGLGVFVEGEDFSLVYDAGSNDDLATGPKNRFTSYLRAVKPGLKSISHVVLSHPHRDHVELLADVIDDYAVGDVWDSGGINSICGYRRFIEAVSKSTTATYHSGAHDVGKHKIDFDGETCSGKLPATRALQHGDRVQEGAAILLGKNATMTFLHVDSKTYGGTCNPNSLVAVLDLDGSKVLLMGDAEAGGREDPSKPPSPNSVEGYVLAKYPAQIDADVLIAGHHGSKSSSRKVFVDAVSPKISVISSGPKQYGTNVVLPDPVIEKELRDASELFGTYKDDDACLHEKKKIGPDDDDRPGGCSNVQIKIQGGKLSGSIPKLSD
jgi:competence protein ComEC